MRRRGTTRVDEGDRERAFTVKALVLNLLLFRDGIGVREIQAGIQEITGGIEIGHSAVFTAAQTLIADGLVVAAKEPRVSGGGPPMLLLRITEEGRRVAGDMRRQAERLLFWPQFKEELSRRQPKE